MVAAVPRGLESAPYLDFPLYLIDLAAISEKRIHGHPAVGALLSALQAAAAGKLSEDRFDRIVATLFKAHPDFRFPRWLTALSSYAFCHGRFAEGMETAIDIMGKYLGRKEVEAMTVSIAEELMRKGEAKGRAEGETKGEAKAILMVLGARFGFVPADIRKAVESRSDPLALESLTIHAATCKTIVEFREGLR
jgi:hypothetical protein